MIRPLLAVVFFPSSLVAIHTFALLELSHFLRSCILVMQSYQSYGYPAGQGQPQAYGQPPIPGVDDYDASYYQGVQAYQFAQSSAPPSVESTRNQDFSGYYGQSQGSTRNQDFSGYYGQSQGSYPNQPTIPAGYIFNPRDGYYYPDRTLTDYGQLQQIPPLPTTPFRPPPPPPSEVGTEEEEEARLGSSFNHRLQLLQSIRPNSVKSSSAKKKILTDAEEASGCSVTQENCSFTLKESEVVGNELALVQASSRGEDEDSLETKVSQNHTSKSGSTFPKALALGSFVKPVGLRTRRKSWSSKRFLSFLWQLRQTTSFWVPLL